MILTTVLKLEDSVLLFFADNTLREDLYFELRKHCDLHTVRIYRDNEERYAVVKFRKSVYRITICYNFIIPLWPYLY